MPSANGLALAITLVVPTNYPPPFCPLEKSMREAETIVAGRIVEIHTPRTPADGGWTSEGRYVLAVERAFAGRMEPGAQVLVSGCGDWMCESRYAEYAVGQELLLFLSKDQGVFQPVFGFQSELVLAANEVRDSILGRRRARAREFLDGLPRLVRFARLPRAKQGAAWLDLLRHENPELRQFGLRRFHEIFYLDDELMNRDAYESLSDDELTALFGQVVRLIPPDAKRDTCMRALENLWEHVRSDRPGLRGDLEGNRLAAIERLRSMPPEASEKERLEAAYLCAKLGSLDELPVLLDALRGPDHDSHFGAFSALEQLADSVGLRQRDAFEVLAAHATSTRCEAALGRTAVTLVRSSGALPPLAPKSANLREWAATYREWWATHRDEFGK